MSTSWVTCHNNLVRNYTQMLLHLSDNPVVTLICIINRVRIGILWCKPIVNTKYRYPYFYSPLAQVRLCIMTGLTDESSAMKMNNNFGNFLHHWELCLIAWSLCLFKWIYRFCFKVDAKVYIGNKSDLNHRALVKSSFVDTVASWHRTFDNFFFKFLSHFNLVGVILCGLL